MYTAPTVQPKGLSHDTTRPTQRAFISSEEEALIEWVYQLVGNGCPAWHYELCYTGDRGSNGGSAAYNTAKELCRACRISEKKQQQGSKKRRCVIGVQRTIGVLGGGRNGGASRQILTLKITKASNSREVIQPPGLMKRVQRA